MEIFHFVSLLPNVIGEDVVKMWKNLTHFLLQVSRAPSMAEIFSSSSLDQLLSNINHQF